MDTIPFSPTPADAQKQPKALPKTSPGLPGQAEDAFRRLVGRTVPHWMARNWVSQSMVDTWLLPVPDQTFLFCGNWKRSFLTFHLLETTELYPTIGIRHLAVSPTRQKQSGSGHPWFGLSYSMNGKPYWNKQCRGMTQVFDHCPIFFWKAHHRRRCPTKTHLFPKENCSFSGNISSAMANFVTARKIIIKNGLCDYMGKISV